MAVKKKTGAQGKSSAPKKKALPKKAPGKKTISRSKTAPKKARKKTGKKKAGKNRSLGHELKKIGLGLAILVAICLTLAMLADIFIKSDRPVPVATKSPVTKSIGPQKTVITPKKVLFLSQSSQSYQSFLDLDSAHNHCGLFFNIFPKVDRSGKENCLSL